MKKVLRNVMIVAGVILLNSCASDQSKESTVLVDSLNTMDTSTTRLLKDTASSKGTDFNFTEIIKALPENEKDLDYNEDFFNKYETLQKAKLKMIKKDCEEGMFPNTVSCADTVYFAWKMSIKEFTLVACLTEYWNAKGPSIIYHLITVDNATGELIASLPDWAATYAFPIENPEGGTSAGVKYVPGTITNNPVVRISSEDENGQPFTFELSPDGFFVEPYAQFDAETNLQ